MQGNKQIEKAPLLEDPVVVKKFSTFCIMSALEPICFFFHSLYFACDKTRFTVCLDIDKLWLQYILITGGITCSSKYRNNNPWEETIETVIWSQLLMTVG